MELRDLLLLTIQKRASDLHLTYDTPPVLRIDGRLTLMNKESLTREGLKKMIYSILSDVQKEKFEQDKELDFSLAFRNGPLPRQYPFAARRGGGGLPPDPVVRPQYARVGPAAGHGGFCP